MKRFLLFFVVACLFFGEKTWAQCGAGYTRCNIDWDSLQYFPSAGISTYTTLATSQTQNFALGTQKLTLTHNFTGSNAVGNDALNTGETGSFGFGNDVHFIGNGAITATFQKPVDSVKFSLFDIDYNQKVTITTSVGNVVTLAKLGGGSSVLTLLGSGTATAIATASATTVATSSVNGTLNVLITGSVTTFTITTTLSGTTTGEDGSFWLSDIGACSPGTFSSNYFSVAKPFTNQPGYVLVSMYNKCYFVDPATGKAKLLFTDAGTANINSLAYDPVKHEVYYSWDGTGSGGTINPANKTLRRYNYDKDTMGPVVADITALAPTFDAGIETGGAAFYDSSLYLGIDISTFSSAKCIVWKIDFNAAGNATSASQVMAFSQGANDWGDFAVNNGVFYNFNGQAGKESYTHVDLYSKVATNYFPTGANIAKQTAVDWNGNVYSIGDSSSPSPTNGMVIPYNGNGTLNTAAKKTVTVAGSPISGQWRDGAEAFKPMVDFGDAPASYDPVSGDPAVHELSANLYLGSSASKEWLTRGQTALANSDNFDDGLNIMSLVNPSAGSFYCSVKYFNNTGANATICAWVDFNNNGVFDASEGKLVTVASNAAAQTVYIYWNGIITSLAPGQYTYIRLRITSAANGMTVSKPTGWFDDGEVEDYRLIVTFNPLQTNLLSFDAQNKSGMANVSWKVSGEEASTVYTVQRSTDGFAWSNAATQKAMTAAQNSYGFAEPMPAKGTVYYRLQISTAGTTAYSDVHKLVQTATSGFLLSPNPATSTVNVTIQTETAGDVLLELFNAVGRKLLAQTVAVSAGTSQHVLNLPLLPQGQYWVRMQEGVNVETKQLRIVK